MGCHEGKVQALKWTLISDQGANCGTQNIALLTQNKIIISLAE